MLLVVLSECPGLYFHIEGSACPLHRKKHCHTLMPPLGHGGLQFIETKLLDWACSGNEGMTYEEIASEVIKKDGEHPTKQAVDLQTTLSREVPNIRKQKLTVLKASFR